MGPRILLADDHPQLRAVLRLDLTDAGFDVCAEVSDAPSALVAAHAEHPDLCVLDIGMPGDGLGATWDITRELPGMRVVILTASSDCDDVVAAAMAGAEGYLLKDLPTDELAAELRSVLAGERRFLDAGIPGPAPPRAANRAEVTREGRRHAD